MTCGAGTRRVVWTISGRARRLWGRLSLRKESRLRRPAESGAKPAWPRASSVARLGYRKEVRTRNPLVSVRNPSVSVQTPLIFAQIWAGRTCPDFEQASSPSTSRRLRRSSTTTSDLGTSAAFAPSRWQTGRLIQAWRSVLYKMMCFNGK